MSITFAELETVTQSEVCLPRQKATRVGQLHCLIVSVDAERREFLAESARANGWEVTVCDDAYAASMAANRFRHSLVIADMDGAGSEASNELRTLVEQLSTDSAPLLMVCGAEGNPLEEIWARQLGAWLYLSGVDPSCDVASLCSEARQVLQKVSREPAYAA